ncbi:MAG: hypothetical protein U0871_23180 [Gemmataceae bacterium]
MSPAAERVWSQLQALPPDDRAAITARLIHPADDFPGEPCTEEEATDSLMPLIDERLKQIEGGTAVLIPWEQAMDEAEAELKRRRGRP